MILTLGVSLLKTPLACWVGLIFISMPHTPSRGLTLGDGHVPQKTKKGLRREQEVRKECIE